MIQFFLTLISIYFLILRISEPVSSNCFFIDKFEVMDIIIEMENLIFKYLVSFSLFLRIYYEF